MSLRKEAKGRECTVRLPHICSGDPATVVLAHFRMHGLSGMGIKSNDIFGAYCCHACHEVVDKRRFVKDLDPTFVRLAHAMGVFRTQQILLDEGKIGETPEWANA